MSMARVLIACLENWDSLQELPFILNRGGCTVDIFCSKKSWLLSNRHYHNWIECSNQPDEYIQQLKSLAYDKEAAYDWIIPADEKLLNILNTCLTDEADFYRILPLSKIENREIIASKKGLSKLCTSYGILSPKYLVYDHTSVIDSSALQMRYPILLKQDLSWGGGGILFCANENDFRTNLEKTDKAYYTIIQEYIAGKDIGVEALFRKGELVEFNAGEVISYFEGQFTFTTKRQYFNSKRLENELRTIGSKIGINGFASIQFIYDSKEAMYYLLEIDIRPNFWLFAGRFTGHDFSEAVKRFVSNTPVSAHTIYSDESKTTEVAIFYRDLIRVLKRKDIKGLLMWVFNIKSYWKFIPVYDTTLLKRIGKELWGKITGRK